MKVFETETKANERKVNFIDKNNLCVGYDMSQQCCEWADWFIALKPTKVSEDKKQEIESDVLPSAWESYVFDKGWIAYDCGVVMFRLFHGDEELFLHLYNCHEGHYSHGFEFKDGDEIIDEGYL